MLNPVGGNVGIGTASPTAELHIKGAAPEIVIQDGATDSFTSGAVSSSLSFQARNSSVRVLGQIDAIHESTNGTIGGMRFQTRTGDVLGERVRITAAGNVGIGTAVPTALRSTNLEVYNASGSALIASSATTSIATVRLARQDASEGWDINYNHPSAGVLSLSKLGTGAGVKATFDTSGNLGIGTAAPAYKLDVSGTGRFTDSLRILTGATTTSGLIVGGDATAGNTWTIARDNVSTGDLKFISGTSERMRIASTGNLELNHSLVYKGAPASTYNADVNPSAITVANGAAVNFPSFSGLLLVCSHTTGMTTLFLSGGGSTGVALTVPGGAAAGSFAGNASIAGYTWTNDTGQSHTLGFYCVRGRNTR